MCTQFLHKYNRFISLRYVWKSKGSIWHFLIDIKYIAALWKILLCFWQGEKTPSDIRLFGNTRVRISGVNNENPIDWPEAT